MSTHELDIPSVFDPFADVANQYFDTGLSYVHVRMRQRKGKKCLTTIQGLGEKFNFSKIVKDLKKEFCCNGAILYDPELGQLIQLQGDQRKNVHNFLIKEDLVMKGQVKVHGF